MIFKTIRQSLEDVYIAGRKINELNNLKLNATNITAYATALKGLNAKQAELVLSTQGLTVAQKQAILSQAELLGSTGKLTTAELNAILVTKKRNKDQAEALLINTGLITSETAEATATNVVTAAKLKELVATGKLTQAEANLIAAKAGVTLANQKESASFLAGIGTKIKGAGTALKGLGTGILTIAQAHPVIAGITAALALCGGAALVNKVKQEKAAKAIKEAYEEAKNAINEINNTFSENSSKTKEIAKEYAELAQGVNLLTNENKNLSTEKYERFLELSNQLSTLYPSLTKNFDENGVAILDLSGDVDTIVGSLDDLIERQRVLANQEIMKQMPDLFAGYSNNVADLEKQKEDAKKTRDEIKKAYEEIKKYGIYTAFDINGNAKDENDDPVALKLGQYIDLLEKLGITAKQVNLKDSMGQIIGYKLELEDGGDIPNLSGIKDAYVSAFNKASDDVKYAEQQFEAETSSINQYLNTWLQTEFSYNQIEDSGLQKAIQDTLFNFDWSSLPEGIDKNDWEAVSEYLRRNILFSINNINDSDVSEALANIYSGSLNSGELLEAIAKVQEYFGSEHPISINLQAKVDDTQPLINNVKEKLQDDFDDKVGELTLEELHIAAEQVEVPEGTLLSWDELKAKIKEVQDSTLNFENPISSTITSSIEQIATQLEPQFKKLGDAYKEIFTADGFTLDAVDNSMLEDLRKTFTEIEEEIGVTFDTTQLENFFAVLSNSNSTAKQTQEAFNNIATSYLYSTDVLESLNSTTVDSIAKQLESLGITNASQLATEALAAKEEYLAFARREHTDEAGNLVSVTQDLANATADDINVLIAEQGALEGEGIALDEATQKMIAYWIQKQAANGQLSTVGDIQQLSALCEGLGVSSKALRNYIYFKKLASMTDVYDATSIERFSANAEKNMEQAQADIQSIYGKLGGAEINFAVPDTSKKSKSEKDTTKEFDWIEQAIENVEKEVQNLDEVVNSAYSTFSQKNEALAKEIGKVNEEIKLQQQAYDEYMRKADSIGLSDDYKTLIHDGAINIENISDKNLQDKISEYQQWYDKAVDAADAISELSTKVKDLHVTGYELQADRLEELLDNEAITEKQYLSEMDKLYKQYYENQTDYAVQAHEAKLALLNREKQYLNSVANAATSLLDKEIGKVQDNAKEQQKPYEDQIKAAEKQIDAYEEQIKLFEKQIDAHNKQIDAYNKEIDLINDRKKPLQDELDALEDKAREENLILSLQEKQYNLKKAENQKDKLVNYMPDTIVI